MMFRRSLLAAMVTAVAAGAALLPNHAYAQGRNYIALGDSYAFGYTTAAAPASNGDQGYVSLFADSLTARLGGVRPTVTNLAIPGETSTSFFTGAPTVFVNQSPYPDGLIDAPLREQARNTNYPAISFPQFTAQGVPIPGNPQSTALQTKLNQVRSSGQTVDFITIQMGGNDILGVLAQSAFQNLGATPQGQLQQGQILQAQFANLQTRYINLLTSLANPVTGAPNAQILLVGYADPFAGLGVNNPLSGGTPNNPLSTQLTLQANALIQGVATAFGARYVDIYTPFKGNETQYTYIADPSASIGGTPNFHPNALGYSVIAQRIASVSAAPEPGALILLAAGLPGVCLVRFRRRAKRLPVAA